MITRAGGHWPLDVAVPVDSLSVNGEIPVLLSSSSEQGKHEFNGIGGSFGIAAAAGF